MKALTVTCVTALMLAPGAGSTTGTHPGKNGLLAYVKRTPPCIGHECATSIWVSALDGSNAKRLTPVKGKSQVRSHPVWSPDGSKIAYVDNTGPRGASELWVMSANGGGKKKVAAATLFRPYGSTRFSWAADGKELAFVLAETGSVLAVDVRTRKVRELLKLPRYTQAMQLSPSGKLIAYTTQQSSGALFVRPVRGRGVKRVAAVNPWGWNDNFDWSPDSTQLAILLPEPHVPGIVSATGGPVRQLASDINRWERPVWSPDGEMVLTQVQQYGDPNPNAHRTIIEWDRFRTIDVDTRKVSVVGPGAGTCRTLDPDPEIEGKKNPYPCKAYDPSWQPRK